MTVEKITSENSIQYDGCLDPEAADNIGRAYFRTVGLKDDGGTVQAAAIWELKDLDDDDRETRSYLRWVFFSDNSQKELFKEYGRLSSGEKVHTTGFELPFDRFENREDAFNAQGFATKKQEGRDICITVADLKKLFIFKKKNVPDYVRPISELDERTFKRGILNCIFHGNRSMTDDLNELPSDWYERSISCCSESDGRVEGFFLARKTGAGRLKVELLINVGDEPDKDLLNMIRFSGLKTIENYPDDTQIIIPRNDTVARKLTDYLFPGLKGEDALCGKRREKS